MISQLTNSPRWITLKQVINDPRLGWLILLLVCLAPLVELGHGHDFLMHYRLRTLSGEYGLTTWLPYYGYWLILPFALFPAKIALVLWNITNALGLGLLCRYWQVNPLQIAFVFPTMYMFGNGQIEGIMALGVVLGMGTNPLIAGLGLTILSIKPQVTFLIALYILWRRFHWQLFVIPAIVFALSLARWGFWIPEWLAASPMNTGIRDTAWNAAAYPWGLVALPILWFYRDKPAVWLTLTPLIAPYYAIYSLALPLTVGVSWWLWILTWVVTLIYVSGGYTPLWVLVTIGLVWQGSKAVTLQNDKAEK